MRPRDVGVTRASQVPSLDEWVRLFLQFRAIAERNSAPKFLERL